MAKEKAAKVEPLNLQSFEVQWWDTDKIIPYSKNARKNAKAVPEVKKSLTKFGWQQPLVVDEKNVLIVGHTRLLAAKELGLKKVPVKVAKGLSKAEVKAYRLMDNRTGEFAEWDRDLLLDEMQEIQVEDVTFTPEFIGFEVEKVDEPTQEQDWDTSKVDDAFIITVRGPLPLQGKVMDALKKLNLEGVDIEASHVKRKK